MTQMIKCKTCDEEFEFIYDPSDSGVGIVGGIANITKDSSGGTKTVTAYLKCHNNHSDTYQVDIPK